MVDDYVVYGSISLDDLIVQLIDRVSVLELELSELKKDLQYEVEVDINVR